MHFDRLKSNKNLFTVVNKFYFFFNLSKCIIQLLKLSIHSFIHLFNISIISINLSINNIYHIFLSTYLSIYLSTILSIYISINLSTYPSLYLSIKLSISTCMDKKLRANWRLCSVLQDFIH